MDFQRYRQPESAEQPEGLRRQVESEVVADEQTDVKLGYAAGGAEPRQECVGSAQVSERLQQDALRRKPAGRQFRLRHRSAHPVTLPLAAVARVAPRAS